MAIVLKYGAPGPILQSGFAAGLGQARKQQTKNLLDVWQQQNQNQQQLDLQQKAQEFQAGQNDANRLRQQFEDTAQRNFQAGQADLNRRQGMIEDQRRFHQQEYFKLPPIPEHADAAARKMLAEKRSALGELLGKTWDHNDPNVQKAFREAHDAYTSGIEALPPAPSNITHFDSQGNEFDHPIPGKTTPYDKKTMKPLENPQQEAAQKMAEEQRKQDEKAQEEFQKQQDAQQEALAKQQEKYQAATEKYNDKVHAEAIRIQKAKADKSLDPTAEPPALDFEQAKKNLRDAGFAPPQEPATPTFSGLPALKPGDQGYVQPGTPTPTQQPVPSQQPFTGSTAGGPGTYGQPTQAAPPSQQTIDTAVQGGYVFVQTPEEALALPKGTKWVNPEGKTGTRP